MADQPDATLDGTVERVAFHNPDSTYTVAKVTTKDGEVTVVGKLMGVDEGMPLRLTGTWEVDKKYGRQFKVKEYELLTPKTKAGIEKFLGSKAFSGIGPSLAKRIVEKFGTDTLDVIEKTPARLTEVIGIGGQRATTIAKVFADQRHVQDVMVFLYGVGVSGAFAAADRQALRQGRRARGQAEPVSARARGLGHRLSHRGFDRGEARHRARCAGAARSRPAPRARDLGRGRQRSLSRRGIDRNARPSCSAIAADQLPPRLAGLEASG